MAGPKRRYAVESCELIELPRVHDRRGNLTFIESRQHVPFPIERVYYLYDVPGGSQRGGHAHRALHQVIIAASGSFDVLLKDGQGEKRVTLNRSYFGMYVPPMIWRELDEFSSGAVCLVLASAHYDEEDYIRDYERYLEVRCG
jgi:dTDP-4-dehydrorhamnose 3,5-epimerase-like enzyme